MRFEDLGGRLLGAATDFSNHLWPHEQLGIGADVAARLVELSLSIVREGRGPMPLWDFSRRLRHKLGMPPIPVGTLCDAVKAALERANDPRLGVLATSMPGVGYVYDARDEDAHPVRSSR